MLCYWCFKPGVGYHCTRALGALELRCMLLLCLGSLTFTL